MIALSVCLSVFPRTTHPNLRWNTLILRRLLCLPAYKRYRGTVRDVVIRPSVRLPVCLSVCLIPIEQNGAFLGYGYLLL